MSFEALLINNDTFLCPFDFVCYASTNYFKIINQLFKKFG